MKWGINMLNEFNRFYKFGTIVKQKAALFTIAILFTLCVYNLWLGIDTIQIIHAIQAFIISGIVAFIEYGLFHNYEDLNSSCKKKNTLIWFVVANFIFIGSAVLFNWYSNIPVWGSVVLLFILESGLIALRYSIYVMNELDSKALNKNLKTYQDKSNK